MQAFTLKLSGSYERVTMTNAVEDYTIFFIVLWAHPPAAEGVECSQLTTMLLPKGLNSADRAT